MKFKPGDTILLTHKPYLRETEVREKFFVLRQHQNSILYYLLHGVDLYWLNEMKTTRMILTEKTLPWEKSLGF